MKRPLLALGALLLTSPALPIGFYVAPDTPLDLAGAGTVLPWTVARHTAGFTYTTTLPQPLPLPFNTHVDGLYLMGGGDWLFSPESPVDIAGTTYVPEDIVRYSTAGVYSTFFCGTALGIPSGADVDALFLTRQRDDTSLVVSFDVPVTIGATTYEPADLVEFKRTGAGCAGWTAGALFFDASAAVPPIPSTTDVTGADEYGDPATGRRTLVLTFDVPTTLGATTYQPGELVEWDPVIGAFGSLHADPSWSPGARVNGFTLLAAPGTIVPPAMAVTRVGAQIKIDWTASPSCSSGAEDYGVYEGSIGAWYSHGFVSCTDSGSDLMETITPSAGNRYYLVVPNNPNVDGSYGRASSGAERPIGAPACRPRVEIGCP